MSAKFKNYINYFINLVCPAFVFGSITGVLTALVITIYKVCAGIVIGVSESGYSFLRTNPYWIALVIVGFIGLSILLSFLYKKVPFLCNNQPFFVIYLIVTFLIYFVSLFLFSCYIYYSYSFPLLAQIIILSLITLFYIVFYKICQV